MATTEKFNIIPIDGPRADALLEHINVDRWDRGRPAELLRLVAYLSDYPSFAPIRPWHIRGLGRTDRQARYDHQVMVRMTSDRILQRVPTPRGDLWRVNPDLRHWRGVPGIPSWRRVASLFSDPLIDICARPGPNRAGQRPYTAPCWSPEMEIDGVSVSVTDLASRARNMARGARRPGTTLGEPGAPGAPGSAPIPSYSLIPSSSCEEGQEEEASKLVQAVKEALGLEFIQGKGREPLVALCREFPDRIPELTALAPVIIRQGGIKWPSMVAVVLRERALTGRWELDPLPEDREAELQREKRRRQLPGLIASAEQNGAEPGYIDQLRSELKDLGSE